MAQKCHLVVFPLSRIKRYSGEQTQAMRREIGGGGTGWWKKTNNFMNKGSCGSI